jgi:intein/homing endonuclease
MVDTLEGSKPVNEIWLNGNTNYVEVEMENGEVLKLTHHHKLLIQLPNGKTKWKMVIDLEEGDDIVQIE